MQLYRWVCIVGVVCNRPLGVAVYACMAVYGHIVGAHCMRPRAIANRPYETTVVMRNRGVAAYAGGVYVHVVGAVCNRPLGVAVYGHIVGRIACARGRLQIAPTALAHLFNAPMQYFLNII